MAVVIQEVSEEKIESSPEPPPNRHRFSAEDLHHVGNLGFFMEDDRIELPEIWR